MQKTGGCKILLHLFLNLALVSKMQKIRKTHPKGEYYKIPLCADHHVFLNNDRGRIVRNYIYAGIRLLKPPKAFFCFCKHSFSGFRYSVGNG